jgi:hypothetical protein
MSVDQITLAKTAYEIAWQQFTATVGLSPDELALGPSRIRQFIEISITGGETDPARVAASALGLLRQGEQILQSKARLERL